MLCLVCLEKFPLDALPTVATYLTAHDDMDDHGSRLVADAVANFRVLKFDGLQGFAIIRSFLHEATLLVNDFLKQPARTFRFQQFLIKTIARPVADF